jgi:hypothetical protein
VDESTLRINHHFTRGTLDDLIESLRQGKQAGEDLPARRST